MPDTAPIWVKNMLTGSPTRRSVQMLIGVSIAAAVVGIIGATRNPVTLLTLVFLYPAFWMWVALRWADRNNIFPKEEPGTHHPAEPASPNQGGSS